MILLDGQVVSRHILAALKSKIQTLKVSPTLAVILVGHDPASLKYVHLKQQRAAEIGVKVDFRHLPQTTSQTELLDLIARLNHSQVAGYFIQLPLPSDFDRPLVLGQITPTKDVDGLNPASGVTPAVVLGIIELLNFYQIDFSQKNIVIVNDSSLIGQPLKKILSRYTPHLTLLNKYSGNIAPITSQADILISATGVKNLITANMVKPEAVVVDVASGDVDFENVKDKCRYITPTFGGIGPMTIACLLKNLVELLHE
jgi:methylenetetrahydrofolate dehydrogenase (NADP+)/methenyltetrahydrofolate cyclohydrolase